MLVRLRILTKITDINRQSSSEIQQIVPLIQNILASRLGRIVRVIIPEKYHTKKGTAVELHTEVP